MKKFIGIFLALCLAAPLLAQTAGVVQYLDTDGSHLNVSESHALPTTSVVSVGTTTFTAGAPPTTNLHTDLSVTSTAQNVTSLANRTTIFVVNTGTETAWIYMDAGTASATTAPPSIPVYSHGYFSTELDEDKVVSIVASTPTTVTAYQEGY